MSSPDPRAELDALLERGQKLRDDLARSRTRVFEILGIPDEGPVRAEVDADGRLTGLVFAPGWREDRAPAECTAEINRALARAMMAGGIPTPVGLAPGTEPGSEPPSPVDTANLARTVTVTSLLGVVLRVAIQDAWIASVADTDVAREIVVLADEAADAVPRPGDEGGSR